MSVNLAVVRGVCSSPAEVRVLPSGSTLVLLQVTTRTGEEAAVSVPGRRVGSRRRPSPSSTSVTRSSRSAGCAGASSAPVPATASRVEIEASHVVPANRARRVQAALRRATAALESCWSDATRVPILPVRAHIARGAYHGA